MPAQPYLYFEGRCEEALDFYRRAVGAEVPMLMRYSESPEPVPEGVLPPGSGNKVMHGEMRIGDASILVSDGNCSGNTGFGGFGIALTVNEPAEAERLYAGLAEGGTVQMPMSETFFARRFGMVTDRFGVPWLVLASRPDQV